MPRKRIRSCDLILSGVVEDLGGEWTVQDRRFYCRTFDTLVVSHTGSGVVTRQSHACSIADRSYSSAYASLLVISPIMS